MFDGKPGQGPAGEYDALIVLAERYRWTPEQIGHMDLDYIEELLVRLRAEADVAAAKKKRSKRKSRGDDVDLAEIT